MDNKMPEKLKKLLLLKFPILEKIADKMDEIYFQIKNSEDVDSKKDGKTN